MSYMEMSNVRSVNDDAKFDVMLSLVTRKQARNSQRKMVARMSML